MTIKKLLFVPFFIILYALLLYKFSPILKSYDFIFSLSLDTLIQLLILSSLFCLVSLSFVLFTTISQDWKLVAPVGLLAGILPMFFLNSAQGLVLSAGCLMVFTLTFANLENRLKSYLTFEPSSLLSPTIRSLTSFLILVFSFVYFLSVSQIISKSGFQIPDSLIDATIQFAQPQTNQEAQQSGRAGSKTPQNLSNDLIKTAVKDQIQNFIKPYLTFIPAALAVLFFFTFQALTSFINLLIYPLLWLIFFVLEKAKFIQFTTEMRPVKKMVI